MNINNPFESGHIKNYILFYVAIVVIMVLFFIAATLFHDVENVEKKLFSTQTSEEIEINTQRVSQEEEKPSSPFKLMDKRY